MCIRDSTGTAFLSLTERLKLRESQGDLTQFKVGYENAKQSPEKSFSKGLYDVESKENINLEVGSKRNAQTELSSTKVGGNKKKLRLSDENDEDFGDQSFIQRQSLKLVDKDDEDFEPFLKENNQNSNQSDLVFKASGRSQRNAKVNRKKIVLDSDEEDQDEEFCLLYTSPSPRDRQKSRMPSSA
eukprot:TRINITY_DN5433_c0_g1_i2.p2 TRINITY_DN5433_c0_g1~~TRINITY_DN5433_c0_g1_i2.p2  ORF type:complete len:185 (-),score=57.46 TRINITY_DN5433_c0_g1_i2:11-565(-)